MPKYRLKKLRNNKQEKKKPKLDIYIFEIDEKPRQKDNLERNEGKNVYHLHKNKITTRTDLIRSNASRKIAG